MTKKRTNESTASDPSRVRLFLTHERTRVIVGMIVLLIAVYGILTVVSFLFTGGEDQSKLENLALNELFSRKNGIANWGGAIGAFLSEFLVNTSFGLGSLFILYYLFRLGSRMITNRPAPLARIFFLSLLGLMWTSLFFGLFFQWLYRNSFLFLGGRVGEDLAEVLIANIGYFGTILLLCGLLVVILVLCGTRVSSLFEKQIRWPKITLPRLRFPGFKRKPNATPSTHTASTESQPDSATEMTWEVEPASVRKTSKEAPALPAEPGFEVVMPTREEEADHAPSAPLPTLPPLDRDDDYDPRTDLPEYDSTLDLPHYQYPSLDLLQRYEQTDSPVKMEELTANKNRITEVLRNFGVEIISIKATPGPTVTLYEIVPKEGVRIARIRNLEDDIALSLSALGIRIIAPIPGKGTIGIEVPNKEPQIVSMRSILASEKFKNQKADLPIALGKTITNDTFVVDLCKMPHVLVAGATGQGKSVGLNAIITSLLYKKHPSQLKFVLVDPKKVEFPIYSKIEKHFLAKLPDGDEAIITDVTKVVQTLTSITREMDDRYSLLNLAQVRNIKEYNAKFVSRRLNPEKGHRFMPYIVVVIDEFGDLIMTAGKEIELPIARIAQLARAVGIHMVIATQRPSTNIITGTIKANFPARIAFRVSSMIDSRTILDCPGANQLIGRGDMLISQGGGDLVRVQCAFIDTPEVENVARSIGDQRGYATAYELPEATVEEGSGVGEIDMNNRDSKFEEAARLIVATQEGSTSKIQRTLELGYNRAGRIMDQMEKAGIVGPAQGSKPRQVLVMDEVHLEMILKSMKR